jgi:hypothetical protein
MVLNDSLLSIRDRLHFSSGIVALTRKNAMLAYTVPEEKSSPQSKDPPFQTQPAASNLSSGDGLANAGTALPRAKVLIANDSLGLLDSLLGLGEDELDVAGVGHVGVDLLER